MAATGKDDRRESAVSTVADKVRHGVTRVHGDDQRPEKESRQAEDGQPAARCFVYASGARDGTGKIDVEPLNAHPPSRLESERSAATPEIALRHLQLMGS